MSNEHEPSDSQSREHEQEFLMEITGPRSSEVEENEGKASAMIYCLHNGIPVSNVEILELPSTKQELLVFLSAGLAEGRKITDLRVYKVNDFYTDNRDINMNEVDQDREEILDDFDIEEEGIYECHLTIVDAPKKRPFDEVQKMTEEPKLCEICRGEIDDPTHLCSDDNHPLFCANCIQAYLENKVTSSFMGSCPIMFCPSAFHQNRRKIIPYNQWIVHVPTTIARQFTTLATSLLKFQCSSCHIPSTLDLGFEANRSALCYKQLEKMLIDNFGTSNKFSEVEKHVQEYCEGDLSLEEIYSFFYEVFPRLVNATDEEAWDTFSMILRIVSDPERRCNLHLRYLRDHPRIKTLCCNREHCFRCKTKGFHNGRSCVETTEMLDHSVVTCPSCSIALARGDGCDTLTCLCGKQFSWTNEKRINERCNEFIRLFGDNSLSNCVMVLCDHRDNWEEVIRQGAKAYQNRNRIEVNRALTDWFKKKYWPCPSQCCTVLVPETLADGVKEAIELWKNTHAAEVNKRKEENDIALRSVFLNMVKDEHERPVVAHRLMNPSRRSLLGNVDDKMVQSAIKWVEKNRERYNRGVEEYEERSARQFLFLFGKKSVSSVVAYDFDFPQVLYWSLDISNRYLTYTNDGSAVKREGNASSRPAVNARIGNSRATIRIFMEETTHTPSLLAIGLTRQPMPVSDGEGIGMRRDSWGLLQDSAASSNYCTIMECGKSVEKIRKIVKGDTVSLSVDVIEGWCELVINEVDYKHLFKIPTTGNPDEYYFAANIAVNHKLSLVIDNTSSKGALSEFEANESHKQPTPGKLTKLNECHTAMYHTFKKFVRKMMQDCLDDEENETVQISTSSANSLTSGLKYPIEMSGDEWLKMWNNDSKLAFERFQIIQPSILSFLGLNTNRYLRKHSSSRKDESTALTFETLLEAVSWFNHHQNQIKSELRTEMGLNFMVMHGPNAPFIAASNMAEYYTHRVDSDDRLASLAYMHIFPEEMNAWYEYNEVMSDPIVPNVARGCRCLPRHIRTCPNIRRNYA